MQDCLLDLSMSFVLEKLEEFTKVEGEKEEYTAGLSFSQVRGRDPVVA